MPAESHASISPTEATSNATSSAREQAQNRFGRIRLHRVADLRVGQSGAQRLEVLAHPIEIIVR